jgi:hypothetical protein
MKKRMILSICLLSSGFLLTNAEEQKPTAKKKSNFEICKTSSFKKLSDEDKEYIIEQEEQRKILQDKKLQLLNLLEKTGNKQKRQNIRDEIAAIDEELALIEKNKALKLHQ